MPVFLETVQPRCVKQARSEPRMKVRLSGELRCARGAAECRIYDLSRGGACLDADAPHSVGEAVTFVRAGLSVSGTVAWARGKRFGLRFDAPIRATDLLVQMSQSRQAQAQAQAQVSAAPSPSPSS